jgi:predicted membrane channel-forming protein YqfA (hemolysin III family)
VGGASLATWALALAAAALALVAASGRIMGWLGAKTVGRLYLGAYVLMGLSVALFVLRGWVELP